MNTNGQTTDPGASASGPSADALGTSAARARSAVLEKLILEDPGRFRVR